MIVFVTVILSRLIRYAWIWTITLFTAYQDENYFLLKCMAAPTVFLSLFNVIVVKDATQKFLKFWNMDTGNTPKLQRRNTSMLYKICLKEQTVKQNGIRPLYPEIGSVMDVFLDFID